MAGPLHVLLVEDNEADAQLVMRELRRGGFELDWKRVCDEESFLASLKEDFEIILSDHEMPGFSGTRALDLLNEHGPSTPFIIISGTIGEELAVAVMRKGATDYLLKDRLVRLPLAVQQALDQARMKREREKAENAMRESEHKHRHLFESLSEAAFLVECTSRRIIDVNPQGETLLGRIRAGIMGSNLMSLFPAEEAQETAHAIAGTGKGTHLEDATVLAANGRAVPVRISCAPLQLYGRQFVLALMTDVTDRKRAEEALRDSEGRLKLALKASKMGVWEWEFATNTIYWSPEVREIIGAEDLGSAPDSFTRFVHPEDASWVRTELERAVANRTAFVAEFRIVRPDGQVRWLADSGEAIYDEDDKPLRMIGTARDITERRQVEDHLRQSQKMEAVGQLAGGVAHDFNNILTVIQSYASLLEKDIIGREEASSEISLAVERAASLSRQLLAFSRKQFAQMRDLDLNDVVSHMTKMLRRALGDVCSLALNLGPDLPAVHADRGMLEQVLLNLAVNARDAMPGGGKLEIGTELIEVSESDAQAQPEAKAGRAVCLRVTDSGTGIAPENLTRIFEPFFTTKDVNKGTGLGLATVHGIVKQHHGWIQLTSELGHGTIFRIFLPARENTAPVTSRTSTEPASEGGRETILLVDDEPALCAVVGHVLTHLGYRVMEARSGNDAVKLFNAANGNIDLLFTDMVMPDGMTGQQLVGALRAKKPELQVILTTGYSVDPAGRTLISEGRCGFLQKPFSSRDLAAAVRGILKR